MGAKHSARTIFAKNLLAWMKERGLSQMDLARNARGAKKAATFQPQISKILKEKHAPDLDTMQEISEAAGIDLWQLMVPAFDAANPPGLQPTSAQERELYDRLREAAALLPRRQ